tara:strand:+ start:3879 stop:4148 length:270 start_codon:yes stop_codon:yes gene_type:complete
MKLTPLKKNVLIASIARETVSTGGIIIEGTSGMTNNETGRVLAIASDVTLVKVGDEVLIDWAKSKAVTVNNEQRVIIDEDYIMAVIEDR